MKDVYGGVWREEVVLDVRITDLSEAQLAYVGLVVAKRDANNKGFSLRSVAMFAEAFSWFVSLHGECLHRCGESRSWKMLGKIVSNFVSHLP
jgi:hypothetical protein